MRPILYVNAREPRMSVAEGPRSPGPKAVTDSAECACTGEHAVVL